MLLHRWMAMKPLEDTAEKSSTTSPWIRLLQLFHDPKIANSLLNIDVTTPVSGLVVQPLGGYLEQDLE